MTTDATRISIGSIDFYNNKSFVLTNRTGWDIFPGLTGSNIRVPGRDGEIWRSKDFATGRMVLDIYITAFDSTGVVPAGSTAEKQYRANLDLLMAVLGDRFATVKVVKLNNPTDVTTDPRENYAEIGAVFTPDHFGSEPGATVSIELVFPSPFWIDITPKNTVGTASATSPRTITLTNLAGTTAPITDPIVLVYGPATNPRVTDNGSGAWVQYNGTLAAGSRWRVNASTFQSEIGTNLDYNATTYANVNTGTNVLADTGFTGPSLFTINPYQYGTPQLTFTGTSLSASTQVNVLARRKFLS